MRSSIGQMRLSGLLLMAETTRASARRAVAAKYAMEATASLLVSEFATPTTIPRAPQVMETR